MKKLWYIFTRRIHIRNVKPGKFVVMKYRGFEVEALDTEEDYWWSVPNYIVKHCMFSSLGEAQKRVDNYLDDNPTEWGEIVE